MLIPSSLIFISLSLPFQDTVLAMQALAEFAALTYSSNSNMDVKISAGKSFEYDFNINDGNKIVLQRIEVSLFSQNDFVFDRPFACSDASLKENLLWLSQSKRLLKSKKSI